MKGMLSCLHYHSIRRLCPAFVRRGKAFELEGELSRAMEDYEKALALEPELESVKDLLNQLIISQKTVEVTVDAISSNNVSNQEWVEIPQWVEVGIFHLFQIFTSLSDYRRRQLMLTFPSNLKSLRAAAGINDFFWGGRGGCICVAHAFQCGYGKKGTARWRNRDELREGNEYCRQFRSVCTALLPDHRRVTVFSSVKIRFAILASDVTGRRAGNPGL